MRKGFVLVPAAILAFSLACDSSAWPAFIRTRTPSVTPSLTPTPSATSSPTLTPYPTRTPLPTLIPGIEEPVPFGGVSLLVIKLLRRDAFRCAGVDFPVDDPDAREFLILRIKVIEGPPLTSQGVGNWIAKNEINALEIRSPSRDPVRCARYCPTQDEESFVLTQIDLGFIVERGAAGFILVLPDGREIPLDSLSP